MASLCVCVCMPNRFKASYRLPAFEVQRGVGPLPAMPRAVACTVTVYTLTATGTLSIVLWDGQSQPPLPQVECTTACSVFTTVKLDENGTFTLEGGADVALSVDIST